MERSSDFKTTIQAVMFDLMGTCTDWKTAITSALDSCEPLCRVSSPETREELALKWRSGFFAEIHARYQNSLPSEDIDVTHRRVLDWLLCQILVWDQAPSEQDKQQLVRAWHNQVGTIGSPEREGPANNPNTQVD